MGRAKDSQSPAEGVEAPAAPAAPTPIKVRAIADGYYAERYIRAGDVFTLFEGRALLGKWMQEVEPETPENITSSNEMLDQLRVDHLSTMRPSITTATGDKSVLG